MRKIIFVLIIFLINNSYSCDCNKITSESEFQISNFIFIGKIVSVDSKSIFIEALESFKGKLIKKIEIEIDFCTIYPKKDEQWLLYITKKNNKFFVSECGNSRSFNFPFNNNSLNFPTPPPIGLSDEVLNLISEKDFKIAKLELEYDIKNLRFIKTKNEMNLVKNENENLKTQIIYLKSFIGFFILIILILFFIIRTKKKSNNID